MSFFGALGRGLSNIGHGIAHGVSSVGKKVSGAVDSISKVGQKVAGAVGGVADKVKSVAGSVAKGLALAGAGVASLGPEALPVAGALEAGAGVGQAISSGAEAVKGLAGGVGGIASKVGDINRGISGVASKVRSGDVAGAVSGVSNVARQVQDAKMSAQQTTRDTIQRGKDVRQQFKNAVGR